MSAVDYMLMVRRALETLSTGVPVNVTHLAFASLPDREEFRALIEREADAMGLSIVIRDSTDAWLPICEDALLVFRFSDYADAWGLPRADIRG